MKMLIHSGRVIDPANRIDSRLNLLIENGKIACATREMPEADTVIDASGKIVCPGFIDIHMHEDPVEAEPSRMMTPRRMQIVPINESPLIVLVQARRGENARQAGAFSF